MNGRKNTILFYLVLSLLIAIVVISTGCSGKTNTTGKTSSSSETQSGNKASKMKLTSSAFKDGEKIPAKYASTGVPGGTNVTIPLKWENTPAGAKSLAITMVDLTDGGFIHWVLVDIPPSTNEIPEGAYGKTLPKDSYELLNSFGLRGYGGPKPPAKSGDHVYEITVYALRNDKFTIDDQPTLTEIMFAYDGMIMDKASMRGKFSQ